MRWTSPSWAAIVLGILTKIVGFALFFTSSPADKNILLVLPALISGAILLAAGLLGLQMAWNECCDWDDGCDCCGDDCACGDCDDCCAPGKGHEPHHEH